MNKEKYAFDDKDNIVLVGDLNWIELRDIIVRQLNKATSHDELSNCLKHIVLSIGTIETLQETRKRLGLKKLTKKEIEEALGNE